LQVFGIKPFGEPAVALGEQLPGLCFLVLVLLPAVKFIPGRSLVILFLPLTTGKGGLQIANLRAILPCFVFALLQ
jgi:hypothetical protein